MSDSSLDDELAWPHENEEIPPPDIDANLDAWPSESQPVVPTPPEEPTMPTPGEPPASPPAEPSEPDPVEPVVPIPEEPTPRPQRP